MPRLHVLSASTRPGRVGKVIAEWFTKRAAGHGGFDVQLVDLAEVNLPFHDEPNPPLSRVYEHEHTRNWSASVASADAFVFVMPEYNHGYSAPLKNALDYLHHEWQHKPVSFVGYGMMSGGLRAVETIKPVVNALGMLIAVKCVCLVLSRVIGQDGCVRMDEETLAAGDTMLDELLMLTTASAALRPTPGK